jgi:hypothetical protein
MLDNRYSIEVRHGISVRGVRTDCPDLCREHTDARTFMSAPTSHLLFAFCLLAGSLNAAPVPSTLVTNIPGRTTISLDETWRAIVDPCESGIGMRPYQNVKPKTQSDLVEYNFDASGILTVSLAAEALPAITATPRCL